VSQYTHPYNSQAYHPDSLPTVLLQSPYRRKGKLPRLPHSLNSIKPCSPSQFGDGIMSAIDFRTSVKRKEDPKGDRVVITLDGKVSAATKATRLGRPADEGLWFTSTVLALFFDWRKWILDEGQLLIENINVAQTNVQGIRMKCSRVLYHSTKGVLSINRSLWPTLSSIM
jgi:hypothetical protein